MNKDGQDQQDDFLPEGWALAKIGDLICSDGVFIDGDWVETKDQDPLGDVRLIQLADVGDGVYLNRSFRFLTSEKAHELRCTFLEPGDVLIARMPEPLGRACIFPGDEKRSVTVVDVCIVRSGALGINHHWLMWAINSPSFRSSVATLEAGTTRKRISRKNLATITFPIPPLAEQHRIVAEIEKQFTRLEAGVAALKRVQANLKRYCASVLKAACEGRLVPRVGQTSRSALTDVDTDADQRSAPPSEPLFVPFDPEAGIHKSARRLPHWQQEGGTYFITFRLADSIPQEKLWAWQQEQDYWLQRNPLPWTLKQQHEYSERFGERLQRYLDAGYGSCVLRRPECARIVEDSLRFYDGQHYDLSDFVVMPNHVHLLVKPRSGHSLSKILQAWKGFTSKEINRLLGRTGTLWLDEAFDHLVRSRTQLERYRRYIRENPIKAGLREGEFILGCGMWSEVKVEQTSGLLEGARLEEADETSAPHSSKVEQTSGLLVKEEADETSASHLLERILKERRAKWEADELAKMKAKGKAPTDDKWKAKYKEPAAPDVSHLPPLPEGWVWATVEQLGTLGEQPVLTGPFGTNLGTEDFTTDGVPVLTISCLTDRGIVLDKAVFVSEEKAAELDRYRLRPGDLLFSRMASVGRAGIVGGNLDGVLFNYHIMRLRLAPEVLLPKFYMAYVRGSTQVEHYIRDVNHGATRDGINTAQLLAMPVALPPLAEQRRIVAEVERRLSVIDEMEAVVEANLKRAERLRQAILKRAFEGKLVSQDPTDEPAEKLLERIRAECAARGENENRKENDRKKKKALPGQLELPMAVARKKTRS